MPAFCMCTRFGTYIHRYVHPMHVRLSSYIIIRIRHPVMYVFIHMYRRTIDHICRRTRCVLAQDCVRACASCACVHPTYTTCTRLARTCVPLHTGARTQHRCAWPPPGVWGLWPQCIPARRVLAWAPRSRHPACSQPSLRTRHAGTRCCCCCYCCCLSTAPAAGALCVWHGANVGTDDDAMQFANRDAGSVPYRKLYIYQTRTRVVVVGQSKAQDRCSVLTLNRTAGGLDAVQDPVVYSAADCNVLLQRMHNSNAQAGGLQRVCEASGSGSKPA